MHYYEFTENNDWEGEKWHFFIPMLKKHRDAIANLISSTDEFDSPYKISDYVLTESEVDEIVAEEGNTYYMNEFNKCGPLSEELIDRLNVINITEADPFYKGGVWTKIK
jgi:hypothetical protein